jgi:hypothetical protein
MEGGLSDIGKKSWKEIGSETLGHCAYVGSWLEKEEAEVEGVF